jgi:hypothetical protein
MTTRRGFFDSSGRLLREIDESERHAFSAVSGPVAKQHTCFIAKNGGKPEPLGSGTFVQVGDRIYVATAKHLFKDIAPHELIALYWGEEDHRAGAYRKVIACDEHLDLAVIPTPDDMPQCGVPLGNLDLASPCTPDDFFVVSGIPGEKFVINEATKTVMVGHWSLGLIGLPGSAWPSSIERPSSNDVDMLFNYTERFALDASGEPMRQIAPFGLSGGGVWSVPGRTDGVWSPTAAKLVAVQWGVESSKWKYLRATRIKHWLRLLASAFPETRSAIAAACGEGVI